MEPRFRTPQELVEGLQEHSRDARRQLRELLRGPVESLMGGLIAKHGLDEDREIVTAHALQLAENELRFRDPCKVRGQTWTTFRASVLVDLARMAFQPAPGPRHQGDSGSVIIPGSDWYQSEVFFRPFTRVGNLYFGGDWCAGHRLPDGSLWVFVADVTGHGYYAYLLARGLHSLWLGCWGGPRPDFSEPAELLAAMHDQLSACLPEGIFLECTLVRLGPSGRVTVVPAGGTRLLVRRGEGLPQMLQLRGTWLGLAAPTVEEQHELQLGPGDEVLLTTDGAVDQLEGQGGLERAARSAGTCLMSGLRGRLEAALADGPQVDDITLVLIRRRDAVSEGGHVPV